MPAELVARLASFDWPANVRQLRNVVRQVVVASRGRSEAVLPRRVERLLGQASRPGAGAGRRREKATYRDPDTVGEVELREALRSHRWEVRPTAAELRLSS